MMKHRNCPNCAAPYDIELSRCPYCGTAYFDLSVIDIDAHEPFFLKMKANGLLITQLVVPMAASIENRMDQCYVEDSIGNRLAVFTRSVDMTTNLELQARPFKSELAGGKEALYLAETNEE